MKKKHYLIVNKRFFDLDFAYAEYRDGKQNFVKGKYCKGCGGHIGMLDWLPPYELDVSKKKLGDFIFGNYTGFVVSREFKEKYEKTDFQGLYDFRRIDLYYRKKLLDVEYYYPRIKSINAWIDLNRVGISSGELCEVCQKGSTGVDWRDGIVFLEPDKIKEDVFHSDSVGYANVIVSEEFKIFLEEEGFTNLEIMDAEKYVWDPISLLKKSKAGFMSKFKR